MSTIQKVKTWREGKMFVAYMPELDLSSCGYTRKEARKNMIEAAKLFLEEIKNNL